MEKTTGIIVAGGEVALAGGHRFRREPGFPHHTLGCLLAGSLWTRHDGSPELEHAAVDLSLTPPDTPYEVRSRQPHREMWVIFSPPPEWRAWLAWGGGQGLPEGCGSLRLDEPRLRARIVRGLRDAIAYGRSPLPHAARLAELALEQVLVLAAAASGGGGPLDGRLERALGALRGDLARPWREADLARLANLSPSRFAHLFRARLGLPPMRYLERLRMERAKALLLATDEPVRRIADAVGYPDALHFSTRFRRLAGASPRLFRASAGVRDG